MNELEEKLLQLKGYGYHIWFYNLSHSILTFRGEHPEKKSHNVEITFVDVHYFQFPLGWTGDFYPASDSELLEIMSRAGMPHLEKALPMSDIKVHYHLYKADSKHSTIYVLGHLSQIEYDVEPIYN
ncbi:MAG: hypothetical protein ABI986_05590 [Chloroflexota bacterium]